MTIRKADSRPRNWRIDSTHAWRVHESQEASTHQKTETENGKEKEALARDRTGDHPHAAVFLMRLALRGYVNHSTTRADVGGLA